MLCGVRSAPPPARRSARNPPGGHSSRRARARNFSQVPEYVIVRGGTCSSMPGLAAVAADECEALSARGLGALGAGGLMEGR